MHLLVPHLARVTKDTAPATATRQPRSPPSPSTLRCRIVRAALAHRRRHSAEETKDAAHMSEDEGCTIVLQRLNWTRTTLISDLLDVFHVNGVEESSFWMKAILIQGQGSSMLKTFDIAPCCYPLLLGPVFRQKKCILSGIANSSKIIFAFPVKTTKIFGQLFLHCIQTGPNILITRPSRMGVEVGKDTVRRAHFGVFSTSHFTHTALSSDWKVHIFRHRHFFIIHRGFPWKSAHFFVTDGDPNWPFRCLDSPCYISKFHLIPEQQMLIFNWSPNIQWKWNWTNNIKTFHA